MLLGWSVVVVVVEVVVSLLLLLLTTLVCCCAAADGGDCIVDGVDVDVLLLFVVAVVFAVVAPGTGTPKMCVVVYIGVVEKCGLRGINTWSFTIGVFAVINDFKLYT